MYKTVEEEMESFSEKGMPRKAGKLTSQSYFLGEPEGPSVQRSRKRGADERGAGITEKLSEPVLCRSGQMAGDAVK